MANTPPLDDWLIARHSKWNTPPNLINEYVRKATGSAIAQASRVVLGLDYEDMTVVFCIEEKLPGKPLDLLLEKGADGDVNQAIDQIGEVLGKLHSVQVDGFGYLQPDGKGQQTSFAEIMLMANERQAELYAAAKKWNVPTKNITAGLELLHTYRDWISNRNLYIGMEHDQ